MTDPRRLTPLLAPLALAALTVWLAFSAGGFFAGTTATAVVVAGLALVVWITAARRPLDGLSPALGVAVAALGLFALWTLLSQSWSDSAARAVLEFDRALLYALAVLLAGLVAASPRVRRIMPHGLALAFAVICICGLITRLLPEVWSVTTAVQRDRLSYPLTYWNALGAMAAIGIVACLHVAASAREAAAVRALAAGAIPLIAAALLLTFSRGGLAIAPIALVAYLALARPAGAPAALLATVPTTAVGLIVTFRADVLLDATRVTPEVVSQGRTVAIVLAACAVAAAALVVALRPLDRRASAFARHPRARAAATGVGFAAAVVVVIAALAAGLPERVADEVDTFKQGTFLAETSDRRDRLTSFSDNGRVEHWKVAWSAFERRPLTGEGAGTYATLWARDRPTGMEVTDAHSLYVEVLGELGLVGLALVAGGILALLIGTALRARGPGRATAAVAFAALLAWAIHAGIDWDWEMPALTLPVLALAAAAAARTRPEPGAQEAADPPAPVWPGRIPRLIAGLALLALLVTPWSIARSQWHLDDAVASMRAGDCPAAVDQALESNRALSIRPEPFQVLALCDVRLGEGPLALEAMQAAVERDPRNWRLTYGLAVIRASQGLDPRPTLLRAQQQNPESVLVGEAVRRFDTPRPAAWRRLAVTAPLPF